MYNLIVIGYDDETWLENRSVSISYSRFLEYTDTEISKNIRSDLKLIYEYPCLFMAEGENSDVYLGRILKFNIVGRNVSIDFEVLDEVVLDFSAINPYASELDIRQWEINRTHWAVKNVNLYEVFTNIDFGYSIDFIKVLKEYLQDMPELTKKNSSDISLSKESNLESKNKEPKKIKNVTDFIENIFNQGHSKTGLNFYRGHSNHEYKLEPSLFRKTENGSFQYLEDEDTIYNELLTQNFSEFGSDKSTFDRLVRMQHFSLPTRLLDISTNPLIALYFACKGNEKFPGEVISIQVPKEKVKYFDSDTATCIANLCKLTIKDKDSLSAGIQDVNYKTAQQKLYHCIKDDKPYFREAIEENSISQIICIKGKVTNSRINAQSGAFLLFGLDAVLEDINDFGFEITRYLIEANMKQEILLELDLLNINESTLFPYLENSAKYIAKKFKK